MGVIDRPRFQDDGVLAALGVGQLHPVARPEIAIHTRPFLEMVDLDPAASGHGRDHFRDRRAGSARRRCPRRRSTPAGWPDSSTSRKSAASTTRARSATSAGSSSVSTIVSGRHGRATSEAGARGSRSASARAAGTSSSPRATPSASVRHHIARRGSLQCQCDGGLGGQLGDRAGQRGDGNVGRPTGRAAAAADSRRPRRPRRTTPWPPRSRPAADRRIRHRAGSAPPSRPARPRSRSRRSPRRWCRPADCRTRARRPPAAPGRRPAAAPAAG